MFTVNDAHSVSAEWQPAEAKSECQVFYELFCGKILFLRFWNDSQIYNFQESKNYIVLFFLNKYNEASGYTFHIQNYYLHQVIWESRLVS